MVLTINGVDKGVDRPAPMVTFSSFIAVDKGTDKAPAKRRQTEEFIGESVRPVRRYFSKEAKSRLVREGRAVDEEEGQTINL